MTFFRNSIFVLLLYSLTTFSQTKLPSFFSDYMIIQQNDSVNVWGKDMPNAKVKINSSWGEKSSSLADDKGNWSLKIKTPIASYKEHTISVIGSQTIKIKHVLVGEVWFTSGQSNMEMPMKGFSNSPIRGANEFILNSTNKFIRLFKAKRQASFFPEDNVTGVWQAAKPSSVNQFSALGYLFAKKMQSTLDIPVGVISSCWGGTRVKAWMPRATLQNFDFVKLPSKKVNKGAKRQTPSALYNGMIHPFLGYNIKGFLWYQGESDRLESEKYKKLFPSMVASWRNLWNLNYEIPFYYVQIAPFDYAKKDKVSKPNGALLREAQSFCLDIIPNSEMVITSDVGEENDIHPAEKETIANRLSYIALNKNYGFNYVNYKNPTYSSMKIKGNSIEIFFDSITSKRGNGLKSKVKNLQNFYIAGNDKIFYPAEAFITKKRTIEVFSEKVSNPKAVRYGFSNYFKATLFNSFYFPVSSFRTDNWEIE